LQRRTSVRRLAQGWCTPLGWRRHRTEVKHA
jgi:hypothetical protein